MILNFKNVSKAYHQGAKSLQVLQNLNLDIAKAQSLAILGKSGSGKSTFLSLAAGLDRPDQGEIFIHNKNIVNLTEDELARFRSAHIGIIFQQFHLMQNLTALENIMLPLEILSDHLAYEKALHALTQVGLSDRAHHFPAQLSGGEKQRVAIARSLVTKPNIIFADEPSGNLDAQTGATVMQLLFNLVKEIQTTLVLVTHDQELAQNCDSIYELKNHCFEKIK
jgi:putative ABC transport system ATP-binding protein